jgi:hypothetical protein
MFVLLLTCLGAVTARADEITDWVQYLYQSALVAPATSPIVMTRNAAIMQASVFDAVNGIEERFTPIHVQPNALPGASRRAAAVQAAYASLVRLYPAQQADLEAKLAASLAGISSGDAAENSVSIKRGIQWGQTVADAIWAWRSTDGFTPAPAPFVGGNAVGQWRPTPPAFAPGAAPQFAHMTPWVIQSPAQFRPAGPPALSSARYAKDFNETKLMGRIDSTARTADQTLYSLFWGASTSNFFFNQVGIALAAEHHFTFSEESRLLAAVDLAIADAAIGCWDAKYTFVSWRPVTAIPLAGTDGNSDTTADTLWTPLLTTPAHPEYPSAHSCVSGAASRVLASYFGDNTAFNVTSDSPTMAGVTRSFTSFTDVIEEIKNARVFAGIHFRSACDDGGTLGTGVADYVLRNAFLPVQGKRAGQLN